MASASFSHQFFLYIWWIQEGIDFVCSLIGDAFHEFKSYTFNGYSPHVVSFNRQRDNVETLYNYDTLMMTFYVFLAKKLGMSNRIFLMRTDDTSGYIGYDILIMKYYKEGKTSFKIVSKETNITSEEEEVASFHHLHTPHTMVFLTWDKAMESDKECVLELSKEFTEIGTSLAKAGIKVGNILDIIREYYGLKIDYRKCKNMILNVMLPKHGLCVYKENEKISI